VTGAASRSSAPARRSSSGVEDPRPRDRPSQRRRASGPGSTRRWRRRRHRPRRPHHRVTVVGAVVVTVVSRLGRDGGGHDLERLVVWGPDGEGEDEGVLGDLDVAERQGHVTAGGSDPDVRHGRATGDVDACGVTVGRTGERHVVTGEDVDRTERGGVEDLDPGAVGEVAVGVQIPGAPSASRWATTEVLEPAARSPGPRVSVASSVSGSCPAT
jgi:hypothetical protein